MEVFTVKIAGVSVRVHARHSSTREYCGEYLTDEEPLAEITLTDRDLELARAIHEATDIEEGRNPAECSESTLENTALHIRLMDVLIKYEAVLFHGCAVALNGKAYLFCADSGTGKTTHARLWLKQFPGSYILNGDKPILAYREGKICVCGTPWRGKEKYGVNEILPLAGICLLERDTVNRIERIPFRDGYTEMFRHSYSPEGNAGLHAYMKMMQKLGEVPLYRLGCNMEDEAADVCCRAMAGRE